MMIGGAGLVGGVVPGDQEQVDGEVDLVGQGDRVDCEPVGDRRVAGAQRVACEVVDAVVAAAGPVGQRRRVGGAEQPR